MAGMTLEKISQIQHPVLVVYGKKSHFLNTFEYLKENLPRCKTVLIPEGEHYGPLEQPDLHADHLNKFLLSGDALGLLPDQATKAESPRDEVCSG